MKNTRLTQKGAANENIISNSQETISRIEIPTYRQIENERCCASKQHFSKMMYVLLFANRIIYESVTVPYIQKITQAP